MIRVSPDIVNSAKIVTDNIEQISKMSNQQLNKISQVTMGISHVSNVVQTNSAAAEESAAASEKLSIQAQLLKNLVNKFRLRN